MPGLWTWEAFAHGAEAVCYFRWRQAPFAQEQNHSGLLRTDSAAAPGLKEATKVAAELAQAPDVETGPAPVGLVFDYESAWAWDAQPQGRELDNMALVLDTYRALRRLGLSIDILPPDTEDLRAYALVAIPGLMYWHPQLAAALSRHDGIACIGPRTGSRDETFVIPAALAPDLPTLLDIKVDRVESLPSFAPVPLQHGGAFVRWREFAEAGPESRVIEKTVDGHPAVLAHGNCRYLAGWPDRPAYLRLLHALCAEAGLDILFLPDGVRVRDSGRYRFVFNYDAETVDPTQLGLSGQPIVGDFPLPPGGVAVLEHRSG